MQNKMWTILFCFIYFFIKITLHLEENRFIKENEIDDFVGLLNKSLCWNLSHLFIFFYFTNPYHSVIK